MKPNVILIYNFNLGDRHGVAWKRVYMPFAPYKGLTIFLDEGEGDLGLPAVIDVAWFERASGVFRVDLEPTEFVFDPATEDIDNEVEESYRYLQSLGWTRGDWCSGEEQQSK